MPIKRRKDGWSFSVPASISPTGKRYRPFFDSKAKAEAERQIFLANAKRYGSAGNVLTPAESEDARQALDLIKGRGLTLAGIVREHLDRNKAVAQSKTVAEILDAVFRIKAGIDPSPLPGASRKAEALRDSTLNGMKDAFDRTKARIGGMKAIELDTARAKSEVGKAFKSDAGFDLAIRYLKAAFNLAIKAGWTATNPFVGIEREHKKSAEIDILQTADEARVVLDACRDHRQDKAMPDYTRVDATDALPGIAIALFAGIRPGGELLRLTWEDVDFDHGLIRVPGEASKTHTLRHVTMDPNLIALLKPHAGAGPVCCSGWERKYKSVRYASGLNKRQGDILRHTYASAFLASGRAMDDLLQQIGHTTQKTTLKHYIGAMKPHEARAFWMIGPHGWHPLQSVKTSEVKTVANG